MFERLHKIENRFLEVEKLLSDPKVVKDRNAFREYSRELASLNDVVTTFQDYNKVLKDIKESKELLQDGDPDIKEMARDEIDGLKVQKKELEKELKILLVPKDPKDDKNVIIEIRAGTGGEEAALFAGDLYKMYSRYAEKQGWEEEVLTHHGTGTGGLKEIIALIKGKNAYSRFKFERGTHRVQRIPVTETQGRIHTSAVTVAVLPEAEDVEVTIDPSQLKVDVYRSTGPGGQSVNTTDSAVRITHLPTGLVVTCQDEKSQLKNKNKAMKVLKARLLDNMITEQNAKRSEERKSQVGTGDRSGRIRTYNFPQGRVTDHRVGLNLFKLESILQGDIDEIVDNLTTYYRTQAIENAGQTSKSQQD